ncbi:phospholipid methyltransferase (plasmid) [Gemmatirosa kalamazoonensis]|uniref:Phospholipid methyltransferase n=1 Tax=Gemmatirosa kalamazoonensis TaxID=861299 RepID=W0RNG3_9BACT|nr:isoprenylcysteine carboxylmethyltransferase family protein [Gemmatirosa kalamazoonensis]AHG92559.1 phospholipid methyltransferase [Gemmatirosa kalamazoonensis]
MLIRYGNFLFRYRDALFPVVLLALFGLTRPHWPSGDRRLDDLLDLLGVSLAVVGQALRVAVIGYAYIIRGGRDRRVYAEGLVTGGLFAHCRNPLYVGNLLILAGLLVVWNNPFTYALGIPFFVLGYVAIVAAEEAFLRDRFGAAYDAYSAAVPRWGFRPRGLRASLAGLPFDWRRVIVKEYGSAAYWVAGACLLMLGDSLAHEPWDARPTYHAALLAGVPATAVLWALARWLKKSRRLVAST